MILIPFFFLAAIIATSGTPAPVKSSQQIRTQTINEIGPR